MPLSSGADTQSKRVPDLIINVRPAKRHGESVRIDVTRTSAFQKHLTVQTRISLKVEVPHRSCGVSRPKSAVIGVCHAFVVFDTH